MKNEIKIINKNFLTRMIQKKCFHNIKKCTNHLVSIQEIHNFISFTNAPTKHFLPSTFTHTHYTHYYTTLLHSFAPIFMCYQSISLGLLRSDLMLESTCCASNDKKRPYCCWKQVEINTIASGFGHLGPISREIQRFHSYRFFIPKSSLFG